MRTLVTTRITSGTIRESESESESENERVREIEGGGGKKKGAGPSEPSQDSTLAENPLDDFAPAYFPTNLGISLHARASE